MSTGFNTSNAHPGTKGACRSPGDYTVLSELRRQMVYRRFGVPRPDCQLCAAMETARRSECDDASL